LTFGFTCHQICVIAASATYSPRRELRRGRGRDAGELSSPSGSKELDVPVESRFLKEGLGDCLSTRERGRDIGMPGESEVLLKGVVAVAEPVFRTSSEGRILAKVLINV
jgi:hypothetical protein